MVTHGGDTVADHFFLHFSDSPRRRGGCVSAGSGTTRASVTASGLTQEAQVEEVVSENFPVRVLLTLAVATAIFVVYVGFHSLSLKTNSSHMEKFLPLQQMVIENAREKILKDRSLQEKLAENINKILARCSILIPS